MIGGKEIGRAVVAGVVDELAGAQELTAAHVTRHGLDGVLPVIAFRAGNVHVAAAAFVQAVALFFPEFFITAGDVIQCQAHIGLHFSRYGQLQGERLADHRAGPQLPVSAVIGIGVRALDRLAFFIQQP